MFSLFEEQINSKQNSVVFFFSSGPAATRAPAAVVVEFAVGLVLRKRVASRRIQNTGVEVVPVCTLSGCGSARRAFAMTRRRGHIQVRMVQGLTSGVTRCGGLPLRHMVLIDRDQRSFFFFSFETLAKYFPVARTFGIRLATLGRHSHQLSRTDPGTLVVARSLAPAHWNLSCSTCSAPRTMAAGGSAPEEPTVKM